MSLLGNFLQATAAVLGMALTVYGWIVFIRVLLSWVNPDPYNPIVQFLSRVTDPVLYKIREKLPMTGVGLDFSPLVLLLGIMFLKIFLVQSLMDLAMQLKAI
ncbi:MAG: YggT family protein [Candidatus Nitronauta litoralis]|uniref:YggT family protein n=1 Tax=Candidatus Nitronauta litoralis TaxID=2705533 RepID=A0A7T0BTD2_9BACT|nr:MAG: YggT family protein [Candidatus Nitronauta litoralis]